MSDINEDNLVAVMNLFVAINKLSMHMPTNQAIDALDKYFNTGDMEGILSYDVRDFITNTNLRENILPIMNGNYNHLSEYINELRSVKGKKL